MEAMQWMCAEMEQCQAEPKTRPGWFFRNSGEVQSPGLILVLWLSEPVEGRFLVGLLFLLMMYMHVLTHARESSCPTDSHRPQIPQSCNSRGLGVSWRPNFRQKQSVCSASLCLWQAQETGSHLYTQGPSGK